MSFLYPFVHTFYRSSTLLYLIITCIVGFVNTDNNCDKIRTSGTGTILFNPTDIRKICWSHEEIALLTARVILEDVMPDAKIISIQCNEDIEDLIDYFKVVINTIRTNTKARKRHIMLLALTDLLGGYLHHALLPMARKAYYSGAVDYAYMEKVIQFYEEIKWFLRTNGQGWTKPMLITKEVKVPVIDIESSNADKKENDSSCRKVMFYEHEPLRSRKRSISIEKGIYFPLPFFDAKARPTAIAVPLKHFALRNIESKRAAYVIMKYFLTAELCLKEKNAKHEMVQKFHNNLYTWIEKEVLTKLDDDKFYSAFGGILRVQHTLQALGAKIGSKLCNTDEGEEEIGAIPGVGCGSNRNKLLLIAMLVIIVAWFLIGTCFICYRMKNSKTASKVRDLDDTKGSKGSPSSSSFSSSRWSSMLSKSTSKTDKDMLCKCCESTISEKSTAGLSSTSEYESEKNRRRERRNGKSIRAPSKKFTQSSPCVCPSGNDPAVIDTKHSMKILPSIAEMSEQSISKEKNGNFRKISFAEESGISSSDGGIKVCAPPWAQTNDTIPCPILSEKSTNYSTSRSTTAKSHGVQGSFSDGPLASSSRTDDPSLAQRSSQFNQSYPSKNETLRSSPSYPSKNETVRSTQSYPSKNETVRSNQSYSKNETVWPNQSDTTREFDEPLANSTMKPETTETVNDYGTSNTVLENSSSKSLTRHVSTSGTVQEYSYDEEKLKSKEDSKSKEEEKENLYYDYHMGACHSSISGSYDLFHKPDPNKPYIFGYDFQTSTSSEVSDDDDSKY